MTTLQLGLLEGDGIGREVVPAAARVVESALAAAGAAPVEWVRLPLGADAIAEFGAAVPEPTLAALERLPGWILGPHDNASYPEAHRAALPPGGLIRHRFDLFANIRPATVLPGVRATVPDMDLVIVRENTEGFYADRNMYTGSGEFMPTPDVAMAVAVVTRRACERIVRVAFDLARRRRRRVTVVHKANVLSLTTGMYLDVAREIGRDHPDVTLDDQHVDAMAAHLVRRGGDFDVVVTENMFGDILSDLAGELSGSLGTAPSLNASQTKAMAQAAHGAAPDIAGHNRANPTAMILSAAMLLYRLGEFRGDPTLADAARRITRAVRTTTESGVATADLGGLASTSQFTEMVTARVARR
ncbi:isocitrate/isopropylmalate dehydrogenase family protein [Speluncibacter jeojiensis]|uniref:isocitrate/isopropylmalate dehydrogenase family protein n=1 Tax=Speluncibacter jeojiensis TaxID=2710754 RepID=UPI002410284C|nr:isocitrate/isopropylmalate family dehydrogenase [Rhodococcus sp. D2-41]